LPPIDRPVMVSRSQVQVDHDTLPPIDRPVMVSRFQTAHLRFLLQPEHAR
jgi:hypothetical protein